MDRQMTVRLLFAAAALMLLAGGLFGFLRQWLCAALVWVGAAGCLAAALNFKTGRTIEAAGERPLHENSDEVRRGGAEGSPGRNRR